MSGIDEQNLTEELESFYPRDGIEELSRSLNAGTPGLLFPDLQAALLARRLLKKRPRRSLTSGKEIAPRTAAILGLIWGECDAAEYGDFAAEYPGVARFFIGDGERWRIPPLVAGLLLEAFDEGVPPAPEAPAKDAGRQGKATIYSRFETVPELFGATAPLLDEVIPPEFERDEELLGRFRELAGRATASGGPDPVASAERVREFLRGDTARPVSRTLLPHLEERPSRGLTSRARSDRCAAEALFTFAARLRPGGWYTTGQFVDAAAALPEVRGIFSPDYAADYLYYERKSRYRNYLGDSGIHSRQCYIDTPTLFREACLDPLIAGWLALCWFLGLIDLLPADEEPPPFRLWSSATLFRVNSWGAWVLGRTDEEPRWRPRRAIRLSAGAEVAVLTEPAPRAEALLRRVGEEMGERAFRLGRETLLADCTDKEDLERLIEEILTQTELPTPPFWEAYFERLRAGILRLTPLPESLVFRLPRDSALPELIKGEPELATLVRRAEGGVIVVEKESLPRLRRLLARHGVLFDTD